MSTLTTTEPLSSPGDGTDRARDSLRNLILSLFPQLALLGLHDYRIDSVASQTSVVCSPVDLALGLPGAVTVTLTPSILGEQVTPEVGSRIVLAFLDCDRGKPIAICGDPDAQPTLANLLGGTKAAARTDDPLVLGTLTITDSGGATLTYTPTSGPVSGPLATVAISGKVGAGSAKVRIG